MNVPPITRRAALVVGALILVACGGSDAATDQDTSNVDEPTSTSADSEVPTELVGETRPVTVEGEALPPLETEVIADDPALGRPAPILVGENFAGESVRVDATADGPTMLVFLAHWCPHCNREIPKINELRDEGRFPDGLNVVAVSTAVDPSRPNFPPSEWLVDMDWTYPVIADEIDLQRQVLVGAEAFGLNGFPFVTLINGDGTVAARWSGERETDEIVDLVTSNVSLT